MNCLEARRVLTHAGFSPATTEYAMAREHMATCEQCQAQLAQLLTQVEEAGRLCDVVTDLLPQYVSDELNGQVAAAGQSHVRSHLESCPRCAATYDDLRYLLLAQQNRELVEVENYPVFELPFLKPQPVSADPMTWTIHTMRDAKQRVSAVIAISQAYLSSLLVPPAPAWARSAQQSVTPPARHTVVDDVVEAEKWVISVELQRRSSEANDTWDVHLSLASAKPIGPLRATLSYNDETPRHARFDPASEAIFRDVPSAWLGASAHQAAEPIRLTIEPEDV